jgi:FPC/CPF motif-containing protein YcgG
LTPTAPPEQAAPSLFDSEAARANSCYTGVVLTRHDKDRAPHHEDLELRFVPDGHLFPEEDDPEPGWETRFLHDQFRAVAGGDMFPCVGARAALHEFTYRFGVYDRLDSINSAAGMGRDLRRFVSEQERFEGMAETLGRNRSFGHFTSFAAVFKQPIPTSEEEFEGLLWRHLQLLHDADEPAWDETRSATPGDPHFAFCFAGRAFFVVGFNPHASELPRRFGYCTLVFNAEYQIDRLHDEGRFVHFATTIRERYTRLAGRRRRTRQGSTAACAIPRENLGSAPSTSAPTSTAAANPTDLPPFEFGAGLAPLH